MSCGVDCRCNSDPPLLWLWYSLAAAALIRPLTWELTHATGAALKNKKKKKKKIYSYLHASYLMVKNLKVFLVISGSRQGVHSFLIYVPELTYTIKQEKETKDTD